MFPILFTAVITNPEQWPENVWHEDVALMNEAGVNLVSLEFSHGARIKPKPGKFDFKWLDRIMDMLSITVSLSTSRPRPLLLLRGW
jgi:beta-galactosidase